MFFESPPAGNAYDEVPYGDYCHRYSHPSHLATIATLLGLSPQPVESARVLELGCCSGGNLIPVAELFPGASFLGVDYSRLQVEAGQRGAEQIGLRNIEFLQADFRDLGPDLGKFDYIVAHGIYSWVPPDLQEKILRICKENLRPAGIAYVSYNTNPGWRLRAMIRDMLLYRGRDIQSPFERLEAGRQLIEHLARSVPAEDSMYRALLGQELQILQKGDPAYLLHDHLEVHNHPVYFHEFAERAGAAGLQYLAEAEYAGASPRCLPREAQEVLAGLPQGMIDQQQYLDYLVNRTFRASLLCHAEVEVRREFRAHAAMFNWYVAADAKPDDPGGSGASSARASVRSRAGVTAMTDPLLKDAFLALGKVWPSALRISDLVAAVANEGKGAGSLRIAWPLIRCFETGEIELSIQPPAFTTVITEYPRASAYARLQVRSSGSVTSLRHETVSLSDLERNVLQYLNGRNSSLSISRMLAHAALERGVVVEAEGRAIRDEDQLRMKLSDAVAEALAKFAANALLQG